MMVLQSPSTSSHFSETLKLLGSDNLKDDNADIQEFQKRVKTFILDQKWVGKPVALSPPQCARFGWKCCAPNKLQCVSCSAVLCTSLPEMEKCSSYDKCVSEVVNSLKSSHRKHCPWPLAPCPEKFFRMVPVRKETAFGDFVSRLESLLPMETYLPEVKGTVAEALNLSDDHFKAIGDLSHVPDSPFVKSSILLAATGWRRVPGERNKKYITCVHCQRTVGIWFYTTVQPKSRVQCTPKEEAGINDVPPPDEVSSQLAQDSISSGNTEPGEECNDRNASTVTAVPQNCAVVVVCKQEIIDSFESEFTDHLNGKRPSPIESSFNLEDQLPAKKRKLCLETDKPFDALYEHRPWCMWISKNDTANVIQPSADDVKSPSKDNTFVPGYKVYIECLLKNIENSNSSPCSFSSPTKDELNRARELLMTWSSPV